MSTPSVRVREDTETRELRVDWPINARKGDEVKSQSAQWVLS